MKSVEKLRVEEAFGINLRLFPVDIPFNFQK